MQQLAEKKLTDTKSNLKAVVGAVRDLELSQKYFEWLAENGDRMKVSFYFFLNLLIICWSLIWMAREKKQRIVLIFSPRRHSLSPVQRRLMMKRINLG